MSDQVIRGRRRGLHVKQVLGMATVGAAGVLVIAAGPTATGAALRFVPAALASLVEVDWPRWIHNLADLLQILTPLVAILAWVSTRHRHG
jgi:hypothetical protein